MTKKPSSHEKSTRRGPKGGFGHIVMLDDMDGDEGEDAWQNYSPEFRTLLSAFLDKGYSYLRLDADGDEIDGWQTFD